MKSVSIVLIVLILGSAIGVVLINLKMPSISPYSILEHYSDRTLPAPSESDIFDALSVMSYAGEKTTPQEAEAVFYYSVDYFLNEEVIGEMMTYSAREAPCASTAGIVLYLERNDIETAESDVAFAATTVVDYLESSGVYLDPCARNNIEKIRLILGLSP